MTPPSNSKLAVLVAATSETHPFFGHDMFRLAAKNAEAGLVHGIYTATGPLLPRLRERLVEAFLADTEATHALFLDPSLRFPPDAALRLLRHDRPAVYVGYPEAAAPYPGTLWALDGARLIVPEDAEGLAPISGGPLGLALFSRAALERLPAPRFMIGWAPNVSDFIEDDLYFATQLRELGVELVADLALTNEVRRIVQAEISMDEARIALRANALIEP